VLSHEACADLLQYATQVAVASLRGEAPPIALTPPGGDEAGSHPAPSAQWQRSARLDVARPGWA
jgi:hypothetical protein